MIEPRHVVMVMLGEDAMRLLFTQGTTVRCMSGVPTDARLIGVSSDFARMCFVAMFEHPSFPACDLGAEPERRFVGWEIIEHPRAREYDMIPVKIGMDESEWLDMRRWILDRAAEIEGRDRVS